MNLKKVISFALTLALIMIGTGIIAHAQSVEAAEQPAPMQAEQEGAGSEPVSAPSVQEAENIPNKGDYDQSDIVILSIESDPADASKEPAQQEAVLPDAAETESQPERSEDAIIEPQPDPTEAPVEAAQLDSIETPVRDAQPDPAEDAPEEIEIPETSHVNGHNVNMRSEPTSESDRVAVLQDGDPVDVTGKVVNAVGETWYAVSCQGREGFIREDYIIVIGYAPTLPYAYAEEPEIEPVEEPIEEVIEEPEIEPVEEPIEEVIEEPEAEPIEESISADDVMDSMPYLCMIQFFDADGNLIEAYEAETGAPIDAGVIPAVDATFRWVICDAEGNCIGDAPFDFSRIVNDSISLRAMAIDAAPVEPAEEAPAAPERSINVSASWDTDELQMGSRVTLTATLAGYDGLNYTCRWQCAAADDAGNIVGEWQDAQADAYSIDYVLTQENLLTAWRLCVLISE